jgi:hypothetical protein
MPLSMYSSLYRKTKVGTVTVVERAAGFADDSLQICEPVYLYPLRKSIHGYARSSSPCTTSMKASFYLPARITARVPSPVKIGNQRLRSPSL